MRASPSSRAEIGADDGGVVAAPRPARPRRSCGHSPARRRGRRCLITTLMSCSISSTPTPSLVADRHQQLVELRRFARVEAGRRLVEAEQPRLGAHGARDLEPPLRAVGQLAGRPVGVGHQADALQPVPRLARSPPPRRCDSAAGRAGRTRSCPRRASACCAARPAGSPAPSCRETGGCSGRCAPPGLLARSREPIMRSSRILRARRAG